MVAPDSPAAAGGPAPFRRVARNFVRLLGGRGVAGLLELLTIGVLARALTPAELGVVVLVQTYALFVRGLLDFNLYEVLVRFGVPLLEARDEAGFRRLASLTTLIDLGSSLLATLIAVLAAPLSARLLGWDASLPALAIVYSLVLPTTASGTAKAVLRIFDRYELLGMQLAVAPVLRLAGVLAVALLEPAVMHFVVALALATAAANISLIVLGHAELHRRLGALALAGVALRRWQEGFHGLGSFIGIVYWQSNVDMLPKYVSTLLAGAFLGPAAAGYLRLANEAAKILSKPGALVRQVLFPDMARMWFHQAADFAPLLRLALLASAGVGLVFTAASWFGAELLVTLGLGAAYREAGPLLTLMLFAATLELLAGVLRTAGYAMGHAGRILRIHLAGALLYLLAFVVLTPPAGLAGAGIAACIGAIAPAAGIGLLVARSVRAAVAAAAGSQSS